jgi:hypothetical protein
MSLSFNEIEKALIYFEEKNFSEESEKKFLSIFPNYMSFLTSNQFESLTEDEYLILMFESLVVLKAYSDKYGKNIDADAELIESIETANWDKFESLGNMSFDEKINLMMGKEHSEFSDFIISSFEMEDEDEETEEYMDGEISLPAKEIIFITVKTISDSILETVK